MNTENFEKFYDIPHISNSHDEKDSVDPTTHAFESQDAQSNYQFALHLINNNELLKSLKYLKKTVIIEPGRALYWVSLIYTLIQLSKFSEAGSLLEKTNQLGVSDTRLNELTDLLVMSQSGNVNLQKSSNLKGIKFEKSIQIDQSFRLAKAAAKNKNYDEALEIYNYILDRFPANRRAQIGIKKVKLLQEKQRYVSNKGLQIQLGVIASLIEEENYKLALEKLNQTKDKQFNDTDQVAFYFGIIAHKQNEFEKAIGHYSSISKHSSNYTTACANIAGCYMSLGQRKSALDHISKAVNLRPNDADVRCMNGEILEWDKQYESALKEYHAALEFTPYHKGSIIKLVSLLIKLEKFSTAEARIKKALEFEPNSIDFLNKFAEILLWKTDYVKAVEILEKVTRESPKNYFAASNLGIAYLRLERFDAAIATWDNLLTTFPKQETIYLNMLEACEKWNESEKFRNILERAKQNLSSPNIQYNVGLEYFRLKKYDHAELVLNEINIRDLNEPLRIPFLKLKGQVADRLKKFDEAFDYFHRMNTLIRSHPKFTQNKPDEYFDFRVEKLKQLRKASKGEENKYSKDESNICFLVGFPRSGTTLLDTILRSHPNISVIEEQHTLYFAKNAIDQGEAFDYISNFPDDSIKKRARQVYWDALEALPGNIPKENTVVDKFPLNILELPFASFMFPNAKFILSIRHPLDSIMSNWMQDFSLNPAMANMTELSRIVDFYNLAIESYFLCKEKLSLDVVEVRYENLVMDMKAEVLKVLQCLNLPWDDNITNYTDTAMSRGKINTPSYSQVVQPLYTDSSYRWLNYDKYLRCHYPKLETWVNRLGYHSLKTRSS